MERMPEVVQSFGSVVSSADLYAAHKAMADAAGQWPMARRSFTTRFRLTVPFARYGTWWHNERSTRGFKGIALATDAPLPTHVPEFQAETIAGKPCTPTVTADGYPPLVRLADAVPQFDGWQMAMSLAGPERAAGIRAAVLGTPNDRDNMVTELAGHLPAELINYLKGLTR